MSTSENQLTLHQWFTSLDVMLYLSLIHLSSLVSFNRCLKALRSAKEWKSAKECKSERKSEKKGKKSLLEHSVCLSRPKEQVWKWENVENAFAYHWKFHIEYNTLYRVTKRSHMLQHQQQQQKQHHQQSRTMNQDEMGKNDEWR